MKVLVKTIWVGSYQRFAAFNDREHSPKFTKHVLVNCLEALLLFFFVFKSFAMISVENILNSFFVSSLWLGTKKEASHLEYGEVL